MRDSRYREEKFGLTEVKGKERDELAQEDHIHKLTKGAFDQHRSDWCLHLHDARDNGPLTFRVSLRNSCIETSVLQEFGRLSEAKSTTALRPKRGGCKFSEIIVKDLGLN